MNFITKLFDTTGFPARWYCGPAWKAEPAVGWLHIVSDTLIFGAYFAIPILLLWFWARRNDAPFSPVFILFAAFILLCGMTHLVEATIFWTPWYRFSGVLKAATALVSWATVVTLIPIVPKALRLPGLAETNARLQTEIDEKNRLARELEKKNQFSEQQLNRALQAANAGTWEWHLAPRQFIWDEYVHPMFGLKLGQFDDTEKAFFDLVVPEDWEQIRSALEKSLSEKTLFETQFRVMRPSGEERAISARGEVNRDAEDNPVVTGVFWDVTARYRIEQQLQRTADQLRQSNADLEQFAYVASHDLRSPLRGVENLVDFIREDDFENLSETSKDNLATLEARVQRMNVLLDDLLEYSRVGTKPSQAVTIETGQLVKDIVIMISPSKTMEIEVATEMPTLTADIAPLRHVFHNLIENAIKHQDNGSGRVEIACHEDDTNNDFLRFSVSDNGPGIEPRYHDKIFEMFQRINIAVDGSGMGLAISRRSVLRYGGRIWLESTPGEGTTFHFTWPKTIESN